MTLQAYIDESEGEGGTFVLGGFISTVERWAKFTAEWERLLKPFGVLKDGSCHYHFKYNAMAREGRRERIPAFEAVAKNNAIMAVSCKINVNDLQSAIDRIASPVGRHLEFGFFGDPYYFAFRALMDTFHSRRTEFSQFLNPDEKVDFIFDEQKGRQERLVAAWDDYIERRDPEVRRLYGTAPVFRSDDAYLPLQAADMWAGKLREAYEKGNFLEIFAPFPEARVKFPILTMEWDEDQLVCDLLKVAQSSGIEAFDSRVGYLPWVAV